MQTRWTRRGLLCAVGGMYGAAWEGIFDGKTLRGWRAEGNAAWSVEGGELVGRQGPGGAEGDLFTEARWGDFELECEWRMRYPGNSGVWFRWMGPRTGYQADFLDQASHPGVLAGSLYCMGKAFIGENRDASTVKREGWNRLRIRAEGDAISIWQNGKTVVSVRDRTYLGPGSVGIQIHKGAAFTGMEVRLRAMRIRVL